MSSTTTSHVVDFIPGRKGGRNALYDGHIYSLNVKRNEKTYWRCNKCPARMTLCNDTYVNSSAHSHDPQPADVQVHRAKVDLKRLASTTENSTKRIVADAVAGLSFESLARINCDPSSLSRMARRARQKAFSHPVNPTSLQDLILPPSYLRSAGGDTMLLWDSNYSSNLRRSFLFGTEDNLNILDQSDHLVIDGTFKSAPELFTQIFTVHALHPTGWRIPAAYGLLPGKRQQMYENVLEELDSYGPYYPQSVLVDYEAGIRNAVMKVWPGTTLRGCWFHHKQALYRHLQMDGLQADYMVVDSPIRKSFAQIGAIPFMDMAWRFLKPTLPTDMMTFSRYYEDTWIGTSATDPLYDPASWNHHDATQMMLPRSSNIAEGWNNGFASLLGCNNPSIWRFLECMKKEQSLTDMKIAQILTRRPFKRETKWAKFDEELQRIIDDYDNYGDLLEFLTAVGSKLL